MGINFLRKPSSEPEKKRNVPSNGSTKLHQSLEKRAHYKLVSTNRKLKLNEFFVGNLNGFFVTKILEIHGKRHSRKARTKVTLERQVFLSARNSAANLRRASNHSELKMVSAATQFSRKRKISLPESLISESEASDPESVPASKKFKMDQPNMKIPTWGTVSSQQAPEAGGEKSAMVKAEPRLGVGVTASTSGYQPSAPTSPMVSKSGPKRNSWSTVSSEQDPASPVKKRCVRGREPEICSPKPGPQTDQSENYYDDFNQGWQTNFLRKCAELVEVRFSNAIRTTCVKPFYERFETCWAASVEGLQLEASTQPIHREYRDMTNDGSQIVEAFSRDETITLIRNFFLISRAYSLKHPYLLASIHTGLETRKDLFDFNKFQESQHSVAKLCFNIPHRTAAACVLQLQFILTPRTLPFDRNGASKVVAHLFAGFGPDWVTISKLTGFNQFALKTIIALLHRMDPARASAVSWFEIHQRMLNDKEFAPEGPKDRPMGTGGLADGSLLICQTLYCDTDANDGTLPSFGKLISSLRTAGSP